MTENRLDPTPEATRSAVVVPVPEAEQVVGPYRRRLDRSAIAGVPAHVTVLYPFVTPGQIGPDTVRRIAEAVTDIPAFDCMFARVRWFGDHLVWLQPEPELPFRLLTQAVWDRFPEQPPYGGAHGDPAPHLTFGDARVADRASMRLAAGEVKAKLPVTARISRVLLMVGAEAPHSWRTLAEFTLPTD